MLYLVTGQPGASKTLNTIKMVNEEPAFQNRPVYYYNIKGLSPRFGWTELKEDQAYKWFDLPAGSVIIFDEAYKIFPTRGTQSTPPEHVKRLGENRHDAHDVIMICQMGKGQVDTFMRGLVNYHYHFVRPFGAEFTNRFFWPKFQENVDGYFEKQQAQTKLIKFDKKYFGSYHSAEDHIVQKRIPWGRIIGFAAAIFGVVGFAGWAVSTVVGIGGEPESKQQVAKESPQQSVDPGFQNASFRTGQMTTEDWFQARQARVPGFAHTAPIYDEVTEPVTFPRPNCVVWDIEEREGPSRCQCYSQQATKMDVPPDICLQIVRNGWFDATRPDTEEEKQFAVNRHSVERQQPTQRPGYIPPPPAQLIGQGDHLITASHQ